MINAKYIIEQIKNFSEFFILGVPVEVLKSLPDHISLGDVKVFVENRIPHGFGTLFDAVYIGEFPEMRERQIQAMFKDGAMFLSSHSGDEEIKFERIAKDIIHELGHAVVKFDDLQPDLFFDNQLVKEFLAKRQTLADSLHFEGFEVPDEIHDPEFSSEFDNYLFKQVGYDTLEPFTIGLFTSPYSATSIEEYFANGFEEYYSGDIGYLKETCKVLYSKLNSLNKVVKETW